MMKLKQASFLMLSLLFLAACFDSDSDSTEEGEATTASCEDVKKPKLEKDEEFATDFSEVSGTYTLTFAESTSGSGYADGEKLDFEITKDGALVVGEEFVLCYPVLFLGNDQEAIWKADKDGLRFSASSLTNGFNEINVANEYHYNDSSNFIFYGQFSNK